MACDFRKGPGGELAVFCLSTRKPTAPCEVCRKEVHSLLCDGRKASGRPGTCDVKLCSGCAKSRATDHHDTVDLCPRCAGQSALAL